MLVIKRDESKESFNLEKIHHAVEAAFVCCGERQLTESVVKKLDDYVLSKVDISREEDIDVDEIHSIIEQFLMKYNYFNESRTYILGRYKKSLERSEDQRVTKNLSEKLTASNVQNQNANLDERSFGGRMGEATRYVSKDFALNYCMSKKSKMNHLNNEIYIHK
jgi:ribonucleoside-triphosphate reductase